MSRKEYRHIFYFYALKYGEVSKIVPITSTFPLIALVLSVLFLHEKVTAINGFGVFLIICGIVLTKCKKTLLHTSNSVK
ncbi:MAG TPA: EamA family transporter [Thermoanaerobacterales bacterium]|nr:EamA family transporter [Thermoanaerobacterales bacterium]